jgi:4-nitrophenol 2-monooxygenase / 4-nitrocatechol 4-monooxygenase, reductase component
MQGRVEARRLSPDEFREVISHFASGVTVITALHDARPFGTTASAVSSLSLEPPMLLICMNKQSETGRAVAASRRFGVNILGANQVDLAERFAQKGDDKFAGVPVSPGQWGEPLFSEALATLECRVAEETSGGTHYVFLAEVVSGTARGGAPLAYFKGEFGRLELTRDQLERRPDDALANELRAADAELLAAVERGDLTAALDAIRVRSDRMAAIARERIGEG